MPMVGT